MDDLRQKENSVRICLQTIDSHMANLDRLSFETSEALYAMQCRINSSGVALTQTREINAVSPRLVPAPYTATLPTLGDETQSRRANIPFSFQTSCTYNELKLAPFTDYRNAVPSVSPRIVRDDYDVPDSRQRSQTLSDIRNKRRKHLDDAVTQEERDRDVCGLKGTQNQLGLPPTPGGARARPQLLSFAKSRKDFPRRTKPSLLVSPLTPIITPSRTEYSSITDDIDTSSVNNNCSPPGTPTANQLSEPSPHHHRHRKAAAATSSRTHRRGSERNEELKKVEEIEHQRMEYMFQRRIRQLSLTETESYANLAMHVLETIQGEDAATPSEFGEDPHPSEEEEYIKITMDREVKILEEGSTSESGVNLVDEKSSGDGVDVERGGGKGGGAKHKVKIVISDEYEAEAMLSHC